jgi:tRNA threonylcarbamoyladenosine biosynthesis protein TsaE
MMVLDAPTLADTLQVARSLAALVRQGDIIVLEGGLGAGKTAFVSGLAEGLGVTEMVTSPSFVLVKRYDDGFMPLVHADVYRLGSSAEFEDLDLLHSARDGLLAIEWGDAVTGSLPDTFLTVRLDGDDAGKRVIFLTPRGPWTTRPLQELSA